MSKRLLLVSLFFVIATLPLMAAESGPSNTVGFISFTCNDGVYVPFAFPFTYYNAGHVATLNINDIMNGGFTGGNPATGDRIWNQNTLSYCYRNTAGSWVGSWTTIVPGDAYWVRVYPNHVDVTAVTAGEVDTTPLDLGTMASGVYNPVGLREAGTVSVANLGLIAAGFTGGNPATSDRVWDQNTLSYAYFNSTSQAWVGLASGITAGHAIWVQVKSNHASFNWTYTPTGAGFDYVAPAVNPEPIVIPTSQKYLLKAGDKPVSNQGSND